MDNKEYKDTLAQQEDLNWDGNTEPAVEHVYVVDEDRMEKLKKLIHDKP